MKKLGMIILAILALGSLFFACMAINDFTQEYINFGVFVARSTLFWALAGVTGIKFLRLEGVYEDEE